MTDLHDLGPETHTADEFLLWNSIRAVTRPAFEPVYEYLGAALTGAESILDLGGGDGHTLDVLGEEFSDRLTVVDADAEALDRLKDKYPNVRAVQADVVELPFADGAFDAAVSISSFEGFAGQKGLMPSIDRVLKTGGEFTFFRDIPYSMKRLASSMLLGMKPEERGQAYIVPFINQETNVLDQFALLPVEGLALLRERGAATVMGQAALNNLMPYLGPNWFRDIYSDRLELGNLAHQFGVLLAEVTDAMTAEARAVNGLAGHATVKLSRPMTETYDHDLAQVFQTSSMHLSRAVVEADLRTAEPIIVKGSPIRRLRVDESSNIHLHRFSGEPPADATTRVIGRTPVYTATKNQS